ncbi:MAG: hypothetical protein HOC09_04040 [Deltaproteobacteria bacterium]|jgi:hypothetical protein|nr:hypothetical protein [Deltaproteobacteria bacterium]
MYKALPDGCPATEGFNPGEKQVPESRVNRPLLKTQWNGRCGIWPTYKPVFQNYAKQIPDRPAFRCCREREDAVIPAKGCDTSSRSLIQLN